MPAQCRACPAQIFFATQNPTASNPKPRANPLDLLPNKEKGNLRVNFDSKTYDVLTGDELTAARERGEELYISHFVTCPERGKFRQSREKKGGGR